VNKPLVAGFWFCPERKRNSVWPALWISVLNSCCRDLMAAVLGVSARTSEAMVIAPVPLRPFH